MAKANMADVPDANEAGDAPLIDLNEGSIKRLVARAKKRGYITVDQLNEMLPQDQFTSEQIEDVMSSLSDMGVNVVENEDVGEDAEPRTTLPTKSMPRTARTIRLPPSRPARRRKSSTAPTIRCACTCARWARWSCSAARARSPSPSASRPAATR